MDDVIFWCSNCKKDHGGSCPPAVVAIASEVAAVPGQFLGQSGFTAAPWLLPGSSFSGGVVTLSKRQVTVKIQAKPYNGLLHSLLAACSFNLEDVTLGLSSGNLPVTITQDISTGETSLTFLV